MGQAQAQPANSHERIWRMVENKKSSFGLLVQKSFEVIRDHFGRHELIALEKVNLTNCSEARIKVKKNVCGFMPSTIYIKDFKRGNIFLNFSDIEQLNPPSKISKPLVIKGFENSTDLLRIRTTLQDEAVDFSSFPWFWMSQNPPSQCYH